MNFEPTHDLTLDQLKAPLVCHFVDCDPVWVNETQRHLALIRSSGHSIHGERENTEGEHRVNSAEIRWRSQANSADLTHCVSPHSVVAIRFDLSDPEIASWKSFLSTIHELYTKRVIVVIVGGPSPKGARPTDRYFLAFQAAGAVALLTDIFDCEKLASIIDRAAMMVPFGITDWRTRFVNRMPWMPVNNPWVIPG